MKSEEILLSILEDIRVSLSFKVNGVIDSHWRWRLRNKRLYRKYLKKLGISHITYEVDEYFNEDNRYDIDVRFRNEDLISIRSKDLMTSINSLKVILSLQEEIKGVKK